MTRIEIRERPWKALGSDERAAYLALVEGCEHGTVFHTPEWLDAIEESFQPGTRCLLAYLGGRLVGAFPFFAVAGPWPGRTNHSCLRDREMVYGGPLSLTLPGGGGSTGVLESLLDRFESGPRTLIATVLPPPGFPSGLLAARGYRLSEQLTAVIELNRPSAGIWSAVHQKTRNMISKARRAGLRVREARPDDLPLLPLMIARPFERAGREAPSSRFIQMVAKDLARAGRARVLIAALPDGRPVAGSIFLSHRGRSYYWAGGAFAEGYETAASHLVQWEGIEAARADGCREHDLVMIDPATAPGIARFKLRFGARVVPVCRASRRRLLGRVAGRLFRLSASLAPAAAPAPAIATLDRSVDPAPAAAGRSGG